MRFKCKSLFKKFTAGLLAGSLLITSFVSTAFASEATTEVPVAGTNITLTIDENGNVISYTDSTTSNDATDPSTDNSSDDISSNSSTLEEGKQDVEESNISSTGSENKTESIVFDKLYNLVDINVIQTNELLVKTSSINVFTENTNIISNYEDTYIIACSSVEEARYAYSYYIDKVDFISDLSDAFILASDNEDDTNEDNTSSETSENSDIDDNTISEENSSMDNSDKSDNSNTDESVDRLEGVNESDDAIANLNKVDTSNYSGYIALIDTGATGADAYLSVFDDDGYDTHGHGTKMLNYIKEENPNAKILSIKAFDGRTTNAANLYAGIKLAIESRVSVISLSLAGYDIESNAIIKDVIQEALDNGITVVGAAGNYNASAYKFIPGCIDDAIVVGAINADKTKYTSSNFDADVYVVATSTSEATARYTGMFTANSIDEDRTTTTLANASDFSGSDDDINDNRDDGNDNNSNDDSFESKGDIVQTHSDKKAA